MPGGRRQVVGSKVALSEKKLVETAAALEGVSVSTWIHGLVIPAARDRVHRALSESTEPLTQ